MPEPVYVIGAGRTDFKRNFKKEGKSIRHIIVEAARVAVADAGIDPGDLQAGVVGNFASGLFTRQLHLGAFLTEIDDRLRGIPALHVEAACASGGVAVLTAAQQIMGGLHDVVLIVGEFGDSALQSDPGVYRFYGTVTTALNLLGVSWAGNFLTIVANNYGAQPLPWATIVIQAAQQHG